MDRPKVEEEEEAEAAADGAAAAAAALGTDGGGEGDGIGSWLVLLRSSSLFSRQEVYRGKLQEEASYLYS